MHHLLQLCIDFDINISYLLCAPATVPTLYAGISKLITSNKPFHSLSTFLLVPQVWHLLTLCAFINFTYLLTYSVLKIIEVYSTGKCGKCHQ